MNENLKIWNYKNSEIRTVEIDGEPYFVGKDVAAILGYSNTRDALTKHVDEEDKNTVAIHDGIGNPNKTAINESGLYSLILSSKLPNAKKFKRWVTSEVLPELRKNGSYGSNINLEEVIAKTATAVVSEVMKNIIPAFESDTIREYTEIPSIRRRGAYNMKVKVKKIKKNPAPVREQDERNFTWLKQKFNACYKVHIAEHSDKLKNSDKCSNKSDNIHLLANSRNKTAFSDYERNNQQ